MNDGHADVRVLRLGEIAKITSGGTPSRANPAFWGGDKPWVSAKDMKRPIVTSSIECLTDVGFGMASIAPKGSVLVLTRGMTLFKDVPICLVGTEVAFNQDLKALIPVAGVAPEYLAFFLRSRKHTLMSMVDSAGHGTGRLPTEALSDVLVSLPPLAEQERIAAALAVWDDAIEKAEVLLSALRSRKSIIMQAEASTAPTRSLRLGDVCSLAKGAGLSKADVQTRGAYPCILYGELHTIYGEVVTEVHSRTDSLSPCRSKSGDVLMPSSSETAEDLANASALNDEGVLIGSDINILRAKSGGVYDPEYLAHYLRHIERREIARQAQGHSVVHLYGRDIAELVVHLPDIGRQSRVAEVLRTGERELAIVGQLRQKYSSQRQAMSQALLYSSCAVGCSPTAERTS